jgi:hypothetical protein
MAFQADQNDATHPIDPPLESTARAQRPLAL